MFNEILVQIKIKQQIPEASNFQDSHFTYGTVKKSLWCILSSYLQNGPSLLQCYFWLLKEDTTSHHYSFGAVVACGKLQLCTELIRTQKLSSTLMDNRTKTSDPGQIHSDRWVTSKESHWLCSIANILWNHKNSRFRCSLMSWLPVACQVLLPRGIQMQWIRSNSQAVSYQQEQDTS